MRRVAWISAVMVLAFGAANPTPASDKTTATKAYPVADLVYIGPDRRPALYELAVLLLKSIDTEQRAQPIGKAAANGQGPDNLRTATASIVPFNLSVSLIVRGTEDDHKAIVNRLSLLREHKALMSGEKPEAVETKKP